MTRKSESDSDKIVFNSPSDQHQALKQVLSKKQVSMIDLYSVMHFLFSTFSLPR